MTWDLLSDNLIYSAIAVYVLAMVAYAAETAARVNRGVEVTAEVTDEVPAAVGARAPAAAPPSRVAPSSSTAGTPGARVGAVGSSLAVLGLLLNLAGVVTRGLAAERAPWGNMYEFAIVITTTAGATYLALLRRQPVRDLGAWIVGAIVLTLGLAVTVLYTPAGDLVPVLDSYWLVVHVAAAIISGGVFTVGALTTILFMVRQRHDAQAAQAGRTRGRYAAQLPTADTLSRVARGAHVFAFPIWTFAVIAGAIWAENSWGRYWGWDPKETWAFITWVCYAAYLHADATTGWRGSRASWFALAGYAAFVFNFFGVNMWIPGLHSYAGV